MTRLRVNVVPCAQTKADYTLAEMEECISTANKEVKSALGKSWCVVRNSACPIVVTACVHFAVSTTVAFGDVNCLHNCGEMCNPWHFCDIFKRGKNVRSTLHMHTLVR